MKSRLLFYILALMLFSIEFAKAEEVFVLDSTSQLQIIDRKYVQFLERATMNKPPLNSCNSRIGKRRCPATNR